eukprot:TRINITY_DN11328_c0_g1_i10.p1 TRINITY_DN11328_c0_g1~~TRINITY_DN11328_c0_g1_i10.p1  ORF type:complete len:187 (-),score=19.11 TRINITY_DN11328_c0_g1_i10:11-571(-)
MVVIVALFLAMFTVDGLPRAFPRQLVPEEGLLEAVVNKAAVVIYTTNKSNLPVAGVHLTLSRSSSYSVASTTSSLGRSCWQGLASGNYTLRIQAPMGYSFASTSRTIVFDASTNKNTCVDPAFSDTLVLENDDAYVKLQYTDPIQCSGSESADQQLAKFTIQKLGEEIGRAVQQECRDRSRMPSSA